MTDDSTELTEEQLLQIQAIQQAQMSSSNAESEQNTTKTKTVENKSSKKKEPKTAGRYRFVGYSDCSGCSWIRFLLCIGRVGVCLQKEKEDIGCEDVWLLQRELDNWAFG